MSSTGFSVNPDRPIAGQVDIARRCEALGYDTIWVAEISDPDAFVIATAMALATTEVRIGTAIVSLGPRSVPVLAAATAGVAEVSGGRFSLGVGVSTPAIVTGWHGVEAGRPLGRARDSISLLRSILAGEKSAIDGESVKSKGFRLRFPPETVPPLMLAALNERMLETAGAVADSVILNYVPHRRLDAVAEIVARGAEQASRPMPELVVITECAIADDVSAMRADWLRGFAFYLTAPPYRKALAWHGFEDEVNEAYEAYTNGGMAALREAVSERFVDELAVIGTPDEVRERVQALAARGVSLSLASTAGADPFETMEQLASFLSLPERQPVG